MNTHFPLRPQFSSLILTPLTRRWRGLPCLSSLHWSTKSVITVGFNCFCPTKEALNKYALFSSSDMRHHVIYPDCDVKFTGHVTWVGKTSIEAKMHMSQVHAWSWHTRAHWLDKFNPAGSCLHNSWNTIKIRKKGRESCVNEDWNK